MLSEMETEHLRQLAKRGGIEGTEAMDREELLDAINARSGERVWEDPKPADINPNDYEFGYREPR